MPTKRKVFQYSFIPADALREVVTEVQRISDETLAEVRAANPGLPEGHVPSKMLPSTSEEWLGTYVTGLEVSDSSGWTKYDRSEHFFLRLEDPVETYLVHTGIQGILPNGDIFSVTVSFNYYSTTVEVRHPDEHIVDKIMGMCRRAAEANKLPEPSPEEPRIFIGHGNAADWHTLHNYLTSVMGYEVEAYETLPRAGYDIKEVLENATVQNNFALIVMTAEDEQADGTIRARQNVVHEVGLFQGAFGFHRAIVLLEDGAEEFSNIAGVNQLRFPKGQINATHGDVIATLKREFGSFEPGGRPNGGR